MPLSRNDLATIAELCNGAGRPYMTAEIILAAADLDDAKRRLAASDPKAIMRASMLKMQGVTEEQVATMRAERAKPKAAFTPAPPRTALERRDASNATIARQAASMAMTGAFPGYCIP